MTDGLERRGDFLLSSSVRPSADGVDIVVLCSECELRCRIHVTKMPTDKVLAMIEDNALDQIKQRHGEWGCTPMHGPDRPEETP